MICECWNEIQTTQERKIMRNLFELIKRAEQLDSVSFV
jgi:hypothetical protein